MKQTPLGDRVLIKEMTPEGRKAGGMLVADGAMTHKEGEIVAVGPGIYTQTGILVPLTVKTGDKVYYIANTGRELNVDNEMLMLCREGDLIMFDND